MSDLPPPPFDWTAWQARYPELAYITEPIALGYYDQAALMFPGIMSFYAWSVPMQSMLLNLLTAHLAALFSPSATGSASSPLVGRIASATKGSVTVSTDMPPNPNAAWFLQTKYGFQFWQATARSRLGRYRPGPVPYLGVGLLGRGYRSGVI